MVITDKTEKIETKVIEVLINSNDSAPSFITEAQNGDYILSWIDENLNINCYPADIIWSCHDIEQGIEFRIMNDCDCQYWILRLIFDDLQREDKSEQTQHI